MEELLCLCLLLFNSPENDDLLWKRVVDLSEMFQSHLE